MKTNLFTCAVLATIALSSCSKNDDGTLANVLPEDGVIRVTAGVNDLATRGGMDNSNLTSFGLFITNDNAGVPATYTYSNVYMIKNGSSEWIPTNNSAPLDAPMLWNKASDKVTVIAYRSYHISATLGDALNLGVEPDQALPGGVAIQSSDLLWAKSEVTPASPVTTNDIYYNTSTQSLDIKLNHMLSKLRVNVKYGTELTQNSTTPTLGDVVVSGTKNVYTFALSTGTVALDPSSAIPDIKMYHEPTPTLNFAATCEAILVPQTAKFSIKLTVNRTEYEYTFPDTGYTFEGGKLYRLDLLVGKDVVTMDNISASEWTGGNGDGTGIETE